MRKNVSILKSATSEIYLIIITHGMQVELYLTQNNSEQMHISHLGQMYFCSSNRYMIRDISSDWHFQKNQFIKIIRRSGIIQTLAQMI